MLKLVNHKWKIMYNKGILWLLCKVFICDSHKGDGKNCDGKIMFIKIIKWYYKLIIIYKILLVENIFNI